MPTSSSPLETLDIFGTSENAPSSLQQLAPALVELAEFRCIDVTGADALTFLQGQFTNHIMDLQGGDCQITGYCNPKGRALAVLWLLKKEDGCYLLAPEDIADGLLKRL